MSFLIWWFALPALARRLMGAVLVCGIVAGAIGLAVHRYGNSREATGYAAGYNHAVVIETRKQIVIVDSLERRADSVAKLARDSSSALVADRRRFDTAPRYSPRIELLPDSLSRLPRADVVRVIVENTGDTIEAVPRLAAQYWFRSDSMLGVAQRLLNKYAAANQGWANAYTAEHEARVGADSLASLWRARALAPHEAPKGVTVTRAEKYAIRAGELYGAYRVVRIVIQIAKR